MEGDMTQIMQAISTVGFPIVCAAAMFWLVNTTVKDNTEMVRGLKESLITLTSTIDGLRELVQKVTGMRGE